MADDDGDDGLADLLRLKLFLDRMPHELVKRACQRLVAMH
jgi:hypothetical protein